MVGATVFLAANCSGKSDADDLGRSLSPCLVCLRVGVKQGFELFLNVHLNGGYLEPGDVFQWRCCCGDASTLSFVLKILTVRHVREVKSLKLGVLGPFGRR